ncbi:MAG: SRPBCC family protein [Acidimicrobiia bacterium]|nr:SRPBCC family protein [Acidimicrobiia bacterium]
MRAASVHQRHLAAPVADLGALIDTLASPDDRLWPHRTWPAMRFDGPLGVGAAGGHAFVRYHVEDYRPGSSVVFRITGPRGFSGTHRFDAGSDGDGAVLTHTIDGAASLRFAMPWFMVVRPLHDALIEDALDNAEREATGTVAGPARWSWWVRMLRRLLGPKR